MVWSGASPVYDMLHGFGSSSGTISSHWSIILFLILTQFCEASIGVALCPSHSLKSLWSSLTCTVLWLLRPQWRQATPSSHCCRVFWLTSAVEPLLYMTLFCPGASGLAWECSVAPLALAEHRKVSTKTRSTGHTVTSDSLGPGHVAEPKSRAGEVWPGRDSCRWWSVERPVSYSCWLGMQRRMLHRKVQVLL